MQTIAVILIVLAAVIIAIRHIVRTMRNTGNHCANCRRDDKNSENGACCHKN